MSSFFFLFFLPDRATHLDEREAREGDGLETKNILWGWPYIFTAWPLILRIFLAQGFMLFFSRGYLSQLQISFNFNQTSQERYILNTKAQGHQSWKYHREAWADWEPKLSRQIRAKCIVVQFTKWRTKFSNQRRSAGRQKKQDPILMISLNQSSSLQRNRVRLRN